MTKDGLFKHIKELNAIFKKNRFDVVHIHATDPRFILTILAKIYKVKKIIYHVHTLRPSKESVPRKFIRYLNIKLSNTLMACSRQSAESMYKKYSEKAIIINTGIDYDKFKFNQEDRKTIRNQLNLNCDDFLIGTVGRIEKVKNQMFLLQIMNNIVSKNNKIKLLIIGSGQEEDTLKKYVNENGLTESIIFLGKVNDVFRYYSAMDLFCFPSLYEGFGIALLEAQANGLICLASKNVPQQTNITGNVVFMGINTEDLKEWEREILKGLKLNRNRIIEIESKEYEIKNNAQTLLNIYKK